MDQLDNKLDNKKIAETFEMLAKLMEIHGQNAFRAKATANAAYKISKLPFPAAAKTSEELATIPGIGASTANKIAVLLRDGRLPELEDLKDKTPVGVLEMLNVKGLGAKKIIALWHEMGLESLGEVYYACNENRLIGTKGFGLKTQEQIKKAIEFAFASQGWTRYAVAEPEALRLFELLTEQLTERDGQSFPISFTGDFRRRNEILQSIDFLIGAEPAIVAEIIQRLPDLMTEPMDKGQTTDDRTHAAVGPSSRYTFRCSTTNKFLVRIHCCAPRDFYRELVMTTGSPAHLEQLNSLAEIPISNTEQKIYQQLGLQYIEPELREGRDEIARAKENRLPQLIEYTDLKGTLHNHTTYSDGVHTLEEMALYCKNELNLQYLGVCDHSKSAVYARGMPIERVLEQWAEIEQLNKKLAPFHVFKGIESDILADGSLDYPDEILAGFDFIVASVHSNLKMDEEKATRRLITAIENPYTTILGHPTGRLLLAREGYPIDHRRVIDACSANGVVIEINANPLRLDLDWRWHDYAIERGVLLSVNPDAHRTGGLRDMHYGILAARKGGVAIEDCLNTRTVEELKEFFIAKKMGSTSDKIK